MNRDDVEKILNNADTLDYGSQSGYECGMINNLIDKIYDDFEKEIDTHKTNYQGIKRRVDNISKVLNEKNTNFQFTSCDDCKNKIDGIFQEICGNCKRFYGCYFEAKEV